MEFQEFPKMARLSREMIVTEKIDGTNAQNGTGGIGIAAASFCAGDFHAPGSYRIKATPFIFLEDKNAGTNQKMNARL
jgi:hypothetical protein